MEYKVYVEFCGRKLKMTVEAMSAQEAKKAVQDKLIFHKIVKEGDRVVEELMGMFGMR